MRRTSVIIERERIGDTTITLSLFTSRVHPFGVHHIDINGEIVRQITHPREARNEYQAAIAMVRDAMGKGCEEFDRYTIKRAERHPLCWRAYSKLTGDYIGLCVYIDAIGKWRWSVRHGTYGHTTCAAEAWSNFRASLARTHGNKRGNQ